MYQHLKPIGSIASIKIKFRFSLVVLWKLYGLRIFASKIITIIIYVSCHAHSVLYRIIASTELDKGNVRKGAGVFGKTP